MSNVLQLFSLLMFFWWAQCTACEERRSSCSDPRGSAGAGGERYSKERKFSGKVSTVLAIVFFVIVCIHVCMFRLSVYSAYYMHVLHTTLAYREYNLLEHQLVFTALLSVTVLAVTSAVSYCHQFELLCSQLLSSFLVM
jgi:magnesium-transporting ATPase (P-type)